MTEIEKIDGYFRAANYISACQLYLLDNPLLERKLVKNDIKKKIVGHFGTVPGQNFIYAHLNRVITKYDKDILLISGPGHGGNFMISNTYLEGSYTSKYKEITQDKEGLKKLFKQFSFPYGVPSHVAPETPGSIHEGGELGYSLSHAFGAVLDNPDLICACIVGDGEAETGPLATSWHGIKFLNPSKDGIVLPILHLNGYKISNPTIFSRMSNEQIASYFNGLGYKPYLVENDDIYTLHKIMMSTMDKVIEDIDDIKNNKTNRYPMIVLKTKKGLTGPKVVDNKNIEGSFRAHQVPISMEKEEHMELLENWLKSYNPKELFDEFGKLKEEYNICPKGNKRMGSILYSNGGLLRKELVLPDINKYALNIEKGITKAQDMLLLSNYIKDVIENNKSNFRLFAPDEVMSNRLYNVFDVTNRAWQLDIKENDEFLSKDGRIIDSMLSEHMCEGMLEGYLLTGRHGIFTSYEAFIRVVDSMVGQHAKWLKSCNEISFREDISSLNLLLTSNVWQQDHNGYTHQDPGFLSQIADKKKEIVRIYLPSDSNSLICTMDSCLKSKNKINTIVASKHPSYQWLTMDEAKKHFEKGISIWDFVSNDLDPDIIICSIGDTPTIEAIAATKLIKKYIPSIKVRFINVIDLLKLDSTFNYPNSLSDYEYDNLFTVDKPIIFNFHGYPSLIYNLIYYRKNRNVIVKGYIEEGSITTAFDMRVRNEIDRYHLVIEMLNKLNYENKETIINEMNKNLEEHKNYIKENGIDMEKIINWNINE